jgi:hypothetical protein
MTRDRPSPSEDQRLILGLATTYLLSLPVSSPNRTVHNYRVFCTGTYSQISSFQKLCKESAINATNILNMGIRYRKVPLVVALMRAATPVAGSAEAELGKFDRKRASGCVHLS